MKIAIHHRENSFSQHWIEYCKKNNIDYKVVNCYDNDIVSQLQDCDALMWHHYHASVKDTKFAKQLTYSLDMAGKTVFPDYPTNWHFDDKLGQKYLFEAIGAPLVPSHAFYSKKEALKWINETTLPKVFKLRGGASSDNVRLVKSKKEAKKYINRCFGKGFSQYNGWRSLKERWRRYRLGNASLNEVMHGVARLAVPTPFAKMIGKERGYAYFQDFIPNNEYDVRINFIYDKCFASRRKVRSGDFRASGSGLSDFNMDNVPVKTLEVSFEIATKLKLQSAAFDFVMHNGEALIVEVSYAFGYHPEMFKHGYWDKELNYYPGDFDPYGWMVDGVVDSALEKKEDKVSSKL